MASKNPPTVGYAWIAKAGQFQPITSALLILRGKSKGMYKVKAGHMGDVRIVEDYKPLDECRKPESKDRVYEWEEDRL
jgi:hypothetical protein